MDKKLDGFDLYDKKFYRKNLKTEYAADVIISFLHKFFKFKTVADFGCGRGAWLLACKNVGAQQLVGIDGPWNSKDDMLDKSIQFTQANFSEGLIFPTGEKVDLCISLEVGEHIEQRYADKFVSALCKSSDLILFGAAFTGQGGTGHVNENLHSYWAKKFYENKFLPFDIIRPRFWGDDGMDFWYKQNTFLYIKQSSTAFSLAVSHDFSPLLWTSFMDAVHPKLYELKCNHVITTRELIRRLPAAFRETLQQRFRNLLGM